MVKSGADPRFFEEGWLYSSDDDTHPSTMPSSTVWAVYVLAVLPWGSCIAECYFFDSYIALINDIEVVVAHGLKNVH